MKKVSFERIKRGGKTLNIHHFIDGQNKVRITHVPSEDFVGGVVTYPNGLTANLANARKTFNDMVA